MSKPNVSAVPLIGLPPPYSNRPESFAFMSADLEKSGLLPIDVSAYPIQGVGFENSPAYVIQYAHNPRMWVQRIDRLQDKYIGPREYTDIYIPKDGTVEGLSTAKELWVIEGEKKAAKFFKEFGLPTIGIRGCWGFSTRKFSPSGDPMLLPNLQRLLGVGKTMHVVFDADITTNMDVQRAAHRLNYLLEQQYCKIKIYTVPDKKGVDDWLVADPLGRVADLVTQEIQDMATTMRVFCKEAGCTMKMNKDGVELGPDLNETNAAAIVAHRYKGRLIAGVHKGVFLDGDHLGDLQDFRDALLAEFQKFIDPRWTNKVVDAGLNIYIRSHRENMILKFIESVKWDGTPRLNTWAKNYIQAVNCDRYIEEWGRLLITSMIMRITQPGSKCDRLFGLTGKQGIGKTTFFEDLASFDGVSYYETISHSPTGSNSELMTVCEKMQKALIVDMDEGVFMERASATQIKAMITQTHYSYRDLFVKDIITKQVNNIFVTSNNKAETLKDPTGSRRFMLLRALVLKRLPEEERYQIFAEALEKEHDIRRQDWWVIDPHAKTDDLESLTEHERKMSVEEYHNISHFQQSLLDEWCLGIFDETNLFAKVNGLPFLTAHYMQHLVSQSGLPPAQQNILYNRLKDYASDPNYKFILKPSRYRPTQMWFPNDNIKNLYTGGLTNPLSSKAGYILLPRN